MSKKLVVVESPKKAKTINKYLGQDFIVRATVGHIMDLPKGPGKGLGVNIEKGFIPKYEILPDKKDKIQTILDAAKECDEIFLGSDLDKEGEIISFHVSKQLEKYNYKSKRIRFNEITKTAILKAIANPTEIDQNLCRAQQARRVLDRIVGFMVSPYLCSKLSGKLSAGRVQSVVLRMIVEREREILSFVPETFYNITATLYKDKKTEKFIAKYPLRVTKEEKANQIKSDLDSSTYEIGRVVRKESIRNPPAPLITGTLQQDAAAKFKLSAATTMKSAQHLYESGFITYLRTDSVRLSPESVDSVRSWLSQNNYDIPNSPNVYKNKDASQDAHEAIRPTDVALTPTLAKTKMSGDDLSIYNLIWNRFVTSQMKPAIYDTIDVDVETSSGHLLKAEGKTLKYKGWLEIGEEFVKADKDVVLPDLNKGDEVYLITPGVKVQESQTKPPARYNDGTIIKELRRRGIGRPSTYAAIIGVIFGRDYVKRNKNGFVATELGCKVVDDLKQYFSFMDYEYTAKMEKQLDDISDGKLKYLDMMNEFYDGFSKEVRVAQGSQGQDAGISCPECGDRMTIRHGKFGFFAGCVKYPDCKGTVSGIIQDDKFIPKANGKQRDPIPGLKCPKCGAEMYRLDGRFGPMHLCITYPKCDGKRKIPFGKKCSDCGGELYLTVFNGEPKLACMNFHAKGCRHVEDPPKGSDLGWVPPEKVAPKKMDRKVDRVLKKSRKK